MKEYRIVRTQYDSELLQAEAVMNVMAQEGWEVVNVTCSAAEPDIVFIALKREEPALTNPAEPGNFAVAEKDADPALIVKAAEYAVDAGQISVTKLQRHLRLGYSAAAKLVNALERRGIIEHSDGIQPSRVCITAKELTVLKHDLLDKAEDDS